MSFVSIRPICKSSRHASCFNTLREFPTVNGVKANGGALNGSGPVVVNGMVLVNSGYDHFGSLTGNVLLAFGP